jgi:hypothetical protein
MSMDGEEFTRVNSTAGSVNFTAITGQDAGRTKISTVSCGSVPVAEIACLLLQNKPKGRLGAAGMDSRSVPCAFPFLETFQG